MKNIQLDTLDIYCTKTLPYILKSIPESQKYLKGFDCNFTKDSYQATIYEVLFYQLFKIVEPLSEMKFNYMISHGFISYLQRYIR
jgi:acyl-homoserine lactone acylase PvdQ